jgi:hypothetical protein
MTAPAAGNELGAGWLEPGETMRFRLAEFPPALMMVPPFLIVFGPLFKLIRGWRALAVTDRNVYVVRGGGERVSVLFKAPLGSVPVEVQGRGPWLGQYLAVANEKVWIIASAESIETELAAANGR